MGTEKKHPVLRLIKTILIVLGSVIIAIVLLFIAVMIHLFSASREEKKLEDYNLFISKSMAIYGSDPAKAYQNLRVADDIFVQEVQSETLRQDYIQKSRVQYGRDHLEMLGGLYFSGEGIESGKDISKAIEYFERSGSDVSKYVLGAIYYFGADGVPQDKVKAKTYFSSIIKSSKIPIKFIRRAAWFITEINIKNNTPEELETLCHMSKEGMEEKKFWEFPKSMDSLLLPDIPDDNSEVFDIAISSKILESSLPVTAVCALYEKPGCAESVIPFEDECQDAAEQGDVYSMAIMGIILQKEKNPKAAIEWYEKAAKKKNPVALRKLGLMSMKGEGLRKDSAKAIMYYTQAAELGDFPAAYNLGNIYLEGKGVGRDLEKAEKWFKLAKAKGSQNAEKGLLKIASIHKQKIEAERRRKNSERFLRIISFVGVTVPLLIIILIVGYIRRCPSCNKLFAKEIVGSEQLDSESYYKTVTRNDEIRDTEGNVKGTISRKEQVHVTKTRFLIHCRCNKCKHEWSYVEWEEREG